MKHKKYFEFMNEITSDELYSGLLAHGLFSEKLPPIFTSEAFHAYCEKMTCNFQSKPHNFVYYENMRNVNVPRPLAIPNPMCYQLLCKCLSENWGHIQDHFENHTRNCRYKISRIHLRKMHQNYALFEMNYKSWRIDGSPEPDLILGKRYVVTADISSCFPSIYTHSPSWALATKEVAKQTQKDNTQWYNSIDFHTRMIKNNETHGLLIGPHVSNLLSEIVLTVIDSQLSEWDFIRNIDDYTCFVETYEDGQRFLVELGAALRAFDLSLNHKKTALNELPIAAIEHWQRKLNGFRLETSYGKVDFLLTRAYIDYAIELMNENENNASILNYAIKVLNNHELTQNAKEYCAKTVMNLSLLYPYLTSIMDEYIFQKHCSDCPDRKCIIQYANMTYKAGIRTKNYEQVSYALFFAVKYDVEIEGYDVKQAIDSDDCLFLVFFTFIYKAS